MSTQKDILAQEVMPLGKVTQKTYRFDGEGNGAPPALRNLYLEQWAVEGTEPPNALRVTVEVVEQ